MLTVALFGGLRSYGWPAGFWRKPLFKRQHGCGQMLAKRIWRGRNICISALRDYAGALAELEVARRSLPNDPRIFELTGYILRRRGQQEEGLRNLEKSVELDPRKLLHLQQLALSYQNLRRYPEEAAVLDRALTIIPNDVATRTCPRLWLTFIGKPRRGRCMR